jgi:hypothetical protein
MPIDLGTIIRGGLALKTQGEKKSWMSTRNWLDGIYAKFSRRRRTRAANKKTAPALCSLACWPWVSPMFILAAFSALDRTESAIDRFGELLSEVDFSTAPNAEDFVPRFIADQCDDEPLPSPSCRWH